MSACLKTFGAMKIMCVVRSADTGVDTKLSQRIVVSTVTYEAKLWGMRMNERHKLVVVET